MSILTKTLTILTEDIYTTLITLILGYIVYKITKFYVKVLSLPPGPLPIPLLGNIPYFRGTKEHWSVELGKVADKYGPVFTMWMGTFPVVFISDIDLAREAFRKNDFAGRPQSIFNDIMRSGNHTDIICGDYGPEWEALRRVSHSAVQKYSTTDKLINLVIDCVDQTFNLINEREGINKFFSLGEYIHYTFLNILANSAFGKRYDLDDPEYKAIKYAQKDYWAEMNQKFMIWEFIPITRMLDRKAYENGLKIVSEHIQLLKDKFQGHYQDFNESLIRDFCDALICAKNDAIKEGKESVPYLTDDNLARSIFDVFFAGADTSQVTFKWILYYMTYYPEVEKRLRQEIENEIGDRIPTHEDRNRCHYVMAVISEALRIRNVAPLGVVHSAVVTSKIGNYTIPKGTQLTVFQGNILRNEKYWPKANEFIPERFLENGKYMKTRPKAFIPFGVGRRVCLGERLAIADLFLVLVRFLQKTSDFEITVQFDGDTKPDPNQLLEIHPKSHKIAFMSKK